MRAYRPSTRPVSELDQLASLSRSGGHAPNEDALLDFAVQERYRTHIEDKLRTFWDREARSGLGEYDAVDITDKKRWFVLNDLLLLLRKLREAIIATRRVDAFAIEVYELSARLSIQTANHTHLISSLSRLVPDLYNEHERSLRPPPPQLSSRASKPSPQALAESLEGLSLSQPTLSPPHRGLYTSLLLLYYLTHLSSQPSYLSLLATLPTSSIPTPTSPPLHHRAHLALLETNYSSFNRLLRPPPPSSSPTLVKKPPPQPHQLERIVLSFGAEDRRSKAWKVVKGAYMDVGDGDLGWLAGVLGLGEGRGEVESWLEGKGVVRGDGEKGRWGIRKGMD